MTDKEEPVTETEMLLNLADRFVTAFEIFVARLGGPAPEYSPNKIIERHADAFAMLAAGKNFQEASQATGISEKTLIEIWDRNQEEKDAET